MNLASILSAALIVGHVQAGEIQIVLRADQPGKSISSDLVGVFFEDINHAADGGLYAELVQNRSFEYQATAQLTWTPMTAWEPVTRARGRDSWCFR